MNIKEKKEREKSKDKRKQMVDASYSEVMWAKLFFAVRLGFMQLMCKASLIFQSNIELALSVILKERKLYDSKTCCGGVEMFKIWDLLSILICSSILVLKWREVLPMYLELQLAQVNSYARKDLKSSGM